MGDKVDRDSDEQRAEGDQPTTGRWTPPQWLVTEEVFGKQIDKKRNED